MKKRTRLVMGVIATLLFTGCGGSKEMVAYDRESPKYAESSATAGGSNGSHYYASSDSAEGGSSYYEKEALEYGRGFDGGAVTEGDTSLYQSESEKLIRTVTMQLQTKEFDALISYLEARVAAVGGYVQNSMIYGNSKEGSGYRSANLTLRIPQSSLDMFVTGITENATVVKKTENAENVTLQYADTEARLKSLQIEQERFLELLEVADSVETILTLEQHLTELRYEIESYASRLKIYDNKVNYSTVTLDISEVNRIVPVEKDPTVLDRMKDGFADTWYNIKNGAADAVVWLVTNAIYLVVWGVVIVVLILLSRKQVINCKKRKAGTTTEAMTQTDKEKHDGVDSEE